MSHGLGRNLYKANEGVMSFIELGIAAKAIVSSILVILSRNKVRPLNFCSFL